MNVRKIFCLLLAAILLTLMSCGNHTPSGPGDTTDGNSSENPTDTTAAPCTGEFFGYVQNGVQCRIVYEDGLSASVLSTLELVSGRIKELTGVTVKSVNALLPDTGVPEILVGDTGRAESDAFISALKYRDYGFEVSDDYIVIAGKTQDGTVRALNRFYEFINGNEPDTREGVVGVRAEHGFLRTSNYVTKKFTIGGVDVSEFEIVYSSSCEEAARILYECIADLTGYILPCRKASSLAGAAAAKHEILIGNTGRATAGEYYDKKLSKLPSSLDYVITVKDGCLIFAGGCDSVAVAAVREFTRKQSEDSPVELELSGELVRGVGDLSQYSVYPKTDGADVRLMSANVYFYKFTDKRVGIMLDSFVMCSPDVLCLQEMSAQWHRGLDTELSAYGYAQVPFSPNPALGNLPPTANYTPIFYKKAIFNVVASGYEQFDSVKRRPDGDKSSSKSFTWSVFERRSDGLRFAVISTHLTWYGEPIQAEKYRVQDANELLEAVDMLERTYGVPVAIMGDMNSGVGQDAYNTLRSSGMDTAVRLALKTQDANYNTYHELDVYPAQNASMIDHVFVTKQNTTVNYYQTFVNSDVISGSDHTPTIADLTYKK